MRNITFIVLAIFCSCTVHYNNQITSVESCAVHSDKEVTYVDKVYGYSSVFYVLSIGGFNRATAAESIRTLQNAARLKDGQYLANITFDQRRFYFLPFYIKQDIIVSADVLELKDKGKLSYDSLYQKREMFYHTQSSHSFYLNDDVLTFKNNVTRNYFPAKIIQLRKRKARLIFPKTNGKLVTRKILYRNLFTAQTNPHSDLFFGFKIGDSIRYYKLNSESFYFIKNGSIRSYSSHEVLIQDENGAIATIPIESVIINEGNIGSDFKQGYANFLQHNTGIEVCVVINDKIKKGTLKNIAGSSAEISLYNEEDNIFVDILSVFSSKSPFELQHFRSKKYMATNKNVIYVPLQEKGKRYKVIVHGYQYFRVLIELPSGEFKKVSMGELKRLGVD